MEVYAIDPNNFGIENKNPERENNFGIENKNPERVHPSEGSSVGIQHKKRRPLKQKNLKRRRRSNSIISGDPYYDDARFADKYSKRVPSSELKNNLSSHASDPNFGIENKNPQQVHPSEGSSVGIQHKKTRLLKQKNVNPPLRSNGMISSDPYAPSVVEAARFAVEEYNKNQGNEGKIFTLKDIVDAKLQLVGGIRYYLILKAENGCFSKVDVVMTHWDKNVLLDFKLYSKPEATE